MMAVEIPISATPAQTLSIQIGQKSCRISIYQKRTGLFIDLAVNDAPVLSGVLCLDRVWLVRNAYLGFPGDLTFIDTQGTSNPDYTGLGARFKLVSQA